MAWSFSEEQIRRYSRQIVLREVGGRGQRKLLKASVFVVGAGGLGSPAALYLAAAGVGRLGIADPDRVDLSNLHRQVLHRTSDVGRSKVASAADTLAALNPDTQVIQYPTKLTTENVRRILADYDIVVEGSDNFPTKYLVNDACCLLGKPLVYAGVLRFEGQVTTFIPGRGCLRCLFPSPPPAGMVPSCEEAGIFGAVTGIIGAIQAAEAIKLILGLGEPLSERLLLFDALRMEFRTVRWHRRSDCVLCGDWSTIREVNDLGPEYEMATQCQINPKEER